MDSRREFLKKAAMLAGGAGLLQALPASIQKAMAINPAAGSTFLDAEHIVVLMQENRSFDHSYGTLRGVRGFNDPRAITLPSGNPVWLQTNAEGQTYAPFRLNIKDTKATWMSALPHSWENQVDARNDGRYDKWLDVKKSGNKEYAQLPLTLGYYNREDIPFYYALADAFTVCDQNFCSSLTGTTPNRLYLWTGTIREKPSITSKANVRNEDVTYRQEASWTTFPERLEDNNISWRIYQNEISLPMGFTGDEEEWLANFTNNPIEWFSQYQVRYSKGYNKYLKKQVATLPQEVLVLEAKLKNLTGADAEAAQKELETKRVLLKTAQSELEKWNEQRFAKLSQREKNLHEKAFTTNINDPHYHEVESVTYQDGDIEREMKVPKGDILHQFREDVDNGKLPTISWVIAPENFSDHPGAPWYGAWYISEVMDILTKNPEVWKKTIFIVAYDENDGYFDHVPPFVAPHPDRPDTGAVTAGIDTSVEHVTMEQELKRNNPNAQKQARAGTIGLGYRVPLIIASPWSRGGYVNSEVFDHTSILQFMEIFLSHKTGKKIEEPNISAWRRTICGDLTSVFRPYNGEKIELPAFPGKDTFLEGVHKAKFKGLPTGFKQLTSSEIEQIRQNPSALGILPRQEKGTRPSCALPYELYADGRLDADKKTFSIKLVAANTVFGKKAVGSPFHVYAPGKYQGQMVKAWSYAVEAGQHLTGTWPLADFDAGKYHLRVYGPNGFFREFIGQSTDPALEIDCTYEAVKGKKGTLSGNVELKLKNTDGQRALTVELLNHMTQKTETIKVPAGKSTTVPLQTSKQFGWYDFSLKVPGAEGYQRRWAGRVETGRESQSDPVMGGLIS